MLSPWISVPAAGAVVSAIAGLDAYFGGHAVDWLVALCLTDPNTSMEMPLLPMQHGSVLPFAAASCGFASLALFGAWWRFGIAPADRQATPDPDFAVVAALAMLANTRAQTRPHDLALAVIAATDRAPAMHPDIALDLFTPDALDDDLKMFAGLKKATDRGRVICAALDFARIERPNSTALKVIARLALAMRMGPGEIWRHWRTHRLKRQALSLEASFATTSEKPA